MKRKYIKHSNLPPRISISPFFLWFLVMERFNAANWVYIFLFTFLSILTIIEVARLFVDKPTDVLGD